MRELTAIPEKTEVVVVQEGKSLYDQLLELPTESIVLLPGTRTAIHPHSTPTVLHRTGVSGWLITRGAREFIDRAYINRDTLRMLLERRKQETALVLHDGNGIYSR
jgi:hypothetical protein